MGKRVTTPSRRSTRLGAVGLGSFCVAATLAGLSAGTANADIDEVAPSPAVTSRQASQNSVIRINDFGVARGYSEARLADAGEIHAAGGSSTEVRDTTKAVVGKKAQGFLGEYPVGPPIGDW